MESTDKRAFAALFNQLLAYYPETQIDPELVCDGYFEDLSPMSIEQVAGVFKAARRTCRFFPKIPELLAIAEGLLRQQMPACPRCPAGHGLHAGHRISHYPAGPWCDTCQADMSTPRGYLSRPPAIAQHTDAPLQLPEYSSTPLYQEEVQEIIRGVLAALDKKSERLRGMADWQPRTEERWLTKRREELRNQAKEIHHEEN